MACQKLQVLWTYLKTYNYCWATLAKLLRSILLIILQNLQMAILESNKTITIFYFLSRAYKHKQQISCGCNHREY